MTDDLSTNDKLLSAADIGQLENADQIVHFFARLGYDVDDSLLLDHASLGLDTADLRQQLTAIRRVGADPVDGDVVVYLYEARSVTVALTQQIARRFRDRPGEVLLVLTRDYESLDFVLVERENIKGGRVGSGLRQIIRPRTLTVNRRNPGPVDLRVLRRFTFTEADGSYQWEKLRSAFTLAEWSEQYFNNRALFSDYYLTTRLTDPQLTPEWGEDVSLIGREVLRHLADARNRYSRQPEQTIRVALYEPLFVSLGLRPVAQPAGQNAPEQPDYLLYAPDDPATPIAAALTTVWNRNLDDSDETRDTATPDDIPGARVVSVLAAAPVQWVILTNGKLWRLYSATASNKATNYYEIDLDEAIHAPEQRTALQYWWLFFRSQAFQGFLDGLLQKSADYAKELGDRLKGRVFTDIFPHFAEGFIRSRTFDKSSTSTVSDAELNQLFTATMTFLYRLIFILYAESLELLPVYESRGYGEASLDRLKKAVAAAAGTVEDAAPARLAQHYAEDSDQLYRGLQRLFAAIDAGDAGLNLPKYNGGLFSNSTDAGRFLNENAIPDRFLALGLDRLCRDVDAKSQALAFIDFKSLGVRQLGSIYEGLLEFRVRIAAEALAVVKEKGKEVYLPAGQLGGKRAVATLAVGDVYLENDKRERKATGSYYTPDYIVKYIVEHTVGPVLDRKFAALEDRLRAAQRQYREHRERVRVRGGDQSAELFWRREEMLRLADDCLDVKVLDPAMGSGHFLVEAVDFVSDRLIKFLNGWSENPVWALLARTQQEILADMERQGVSIDKERLTRVALLKRSVLKRCIYGVDLNGMAVELAKVSLWLDAFTLGAPLSFLDHHLKWGNSLIGARVGEVRESLQSRADQQLGLFSQSKFAGVMLATDLMRQVSYLSDNTVEQLAASATAYHSAADHLAPYKRVLDVYTSRWFGNEPSKKGTDDALEFLQRTDVEAWLNNPAKGKLPAADYMDSPRIARTALTAAAAKRFFHWELEFPEVFFAPSAPGGQDVQLREDGGFDAVVGNPPYDVFAEKELGYSVEDEIGYFTKIGIFGPALGRKLDLYRLFLCRGSDLIRPNAQLGMIIPMSIMGDQQTSNLRNHIVHDMDILRINAFPQKDDPHRRIFFEAKLPTCVIVVSNSISEKLVQLIVHPGNLLGEVSGSVLIESSNLRKLVKNLDGIPLIQSQGQVSLLLRLERNFDQLDDHLITYQGEINQTTHIAHLSNKPSTGPLVYRGGNVQRYEFIEEARQGEKLYINETSFRKQYGHGKVEHITQARIGYQRKAALDNWRRLIFSTLPTPCYAIESISYYLVEGTTSWFHLALLNSHLMEWRFNLTSTNNMVSTDEISTLPIPRIDFITPADERARLAGEIVGAYNLGDNGSVVHRVQVALNEGQVDVIHDLLAFLAGRMIDLNKEKQAEVKRFLGWLEAKLRIPAPGLDALPGKTILQGYLGDYQKGAKETAWADFYYRLHQNRNLLGVALDGVQGEIQTEYEKSLALLLPVKRQLAHTDNLIDQIVYKLYGLIDAEIELIERPAYEQALADAKAKVAGDETLRADADAAAGVMAEIILPAARRIQSQTAFAAERAALDAALPGWHLFPEEVATFLLSGEYDLHTRPDGLDFSSAVVSFAKAVERMLYHRLLLPWRDAAGALESDARNTFLQAFLRREKELTLGSLAIILQSSRETALRAYIQQCYPHAATSFFGAEGVAARLSDPASVQLRNAAAHDELLGRDAAQSARVWALGILRYL
ncbi:MAG: hypothetical protein DWI57_14410 [Chloroflexi bacterium]|nr:MAG: hypothetical protein DWI57_14410 [Chloroflexota bacterium]